MEVALISKKNCTFAFEISRDDNRCSPQDYELKIVN
jgi:hypothetical protein